MHPNFATLFEALARQEPDAEAIVHGGRRISWASFDDTASRLAAALSDGGVGPGERVALYLHNGPEYLELAYGAFKARAVPVNVNYRYRSGEVDHLLADADARVLVFDGALAEQVAGCRAVDDRRLIQVDDGSAALFEGATWYHDVVAGAGPADPVERSGDDDLILYTGGTTGLPKGVVWHHGDLFNTLAFSAYQAVGLAIPSTPEEAADAAAELRASGSAPRMLSAPPLIHGTALFLSMTAFLRGGTVILLPSGPFDAHELWRQVQAERVTDLAIVGEPFARPMVKALEEAEAGGEPYDISSVRIISSSGIGWSADTKRALRARGDMVMLDMLGASEGGPFATSMTMPGQQPPATATFTIAERAVLLDESGGEIPRGTDRVGLLAYKGAGPIGYHGDPAKTAETFRTIGGERYVVPGDMATVAEDGTVTFLGRGSACINTGGEKVYAEEVEEVLRTHPAVTDCYVVGVPDERYGETVTAVVQTGGAVTDGELVDHVRARLAGYKQPRHLVRVDELVRSPTGKSDYRWALARATAALPGD